MYYYPDTIISIKVDATITISYFHPTVKSVYTFSGQLVEPHIAYQSLKSYQKYVRSVIT